MAAFGRAQINIVSALICTLFGLYYANYEKSCQDTHHKYECHSEHRSYWVLDYEVINRLCVNAQHHTLDIIRPFLRSAEQRHLLCSRFIENVLIAISDKGNK